MIAPSLVETLSAFASGQMPPHAFEEWLYASEQAERHLSEEKSPEYARAHPTLYHYLIGIRFDDPADVLSARGAIAAYLARLGVAKPDVSHDEYRDLVDAQPTWLDLDPKFLSKLCSLAPQGTRQERKNWLRSKLIEQFRCLGSPPKWIQSPAWPFGANGPMVFLGQLQVRNYFHDNTVVYVFHDPSTDEIRTILQSM